MDWAPGYSSDKLMLGLSLLISVSEYWSHFFPTWYKVLQFCCPISLSTHMYTAPSGLLIHID